MWDANSEPPGPSPLLEAGTEVNLAGAAFVQSPAHLAAGGGHAFFLLWQLQTGANLNQQDSLGEAPIHKAAKVGSLECLTLLVASQANINLRNNNSQTAEDLALALGFLECAKFLMTVKQIQNQKAGAQYDSSFPDSDASIHIDASKRQKGVCERNRRVSRKRRRSNDWNSVI
ncbi:ankyrin repeat domain-containing protein 37 isoform X2 [Erythrolamprus reginae]|uniref:ankyrin repeat domain-containing protein 37 isoform X2 n=1 Tax=Erythrolamprus reginae TaxID=121349 RepID=UPI00396C8C6F